MRKTKLDNKTLDAIGKRLFECEDPPSNSIEKIISNPNLFALVNARIAAGANVPHSHSPTSSLTFLRRRAVVFAGIAITFIAVIAAASLLRSENTSNTAKQVQVPGRVPDEVARPLTPFDPLVTKLSVGRAINIEKAVVRPAAKQKDRKPKARAPREPEGEFYALSAGYDMDETAGGERVIRVDMPRSSLFALGVNVPLENDAESVKTDLLIGSDGKPRAIRVVK